MVSNIRITVIIAMGILLVAVVGCSSSAPVKQDRTSGSVYYVSQNGSDKASGKSKDDAWKTIKHAITKAKSGGEIRVLQGTYEEEVQLDNIGNKEKIKIIGYQGRPIIDGQRKLKLGFWLSGAKDVTVENLEIRNYTDVGFGSESSTDITVRDLKVHDNGFNAQLLEDWEIEGYGIDIDTVDGYLVEENEVYRNGPSPKKSPDRLMGTGINTFGSKKGAIRNNKSYENVGGGILVEDSEDITVENNEVYENDLDATADEWWDGGIWLDGGKNVVIRKNNFHDNKGPGILISDEEKAKPGGYVIEDNVSKNNYFGIYIWNFGTNDWPDDDVISRSNNDFSDNKIEDVLINAWDYDPKTLKTPTKEE